MAKNRHHPFFFLSLQMDRHPRPSRPPLAGLSGLRGRCSTPPFRTRRPRPPHCPRRPLSRPPTLTSQTFAFRPCWRSEFFWTTLAGFLRVTDNLKKTSCWQAVNFPHFSFSIGAHSQQAYLSLLTEAHLSRQNENPHPLDLCTSNKGDLEASSSAPSSPSSPSLVKVKGCNLPKKSSPSAKIWSPGLSCEKETSEDRKATMEGAILPQFFHREPSDGRVISKEGKKREERIFKVIAWPQQREWQILTLPFVSISSATSVENASSAVQRCQPIS